MFRQITSAVAVVALVVLASVDAEAQQFKVVYDPSDSGVDPNGPVTVTTTGPIDLDIWAIAPNNPPSGPPCLDPNDGAEYCGWDLQVDATGGVVFDHLDPNAFVQDGNTPLVVFSVTATRFQANGGDAINSEWGNTRIGRLKAIINGDGAITLNGKAVVDGGLQLVNLAPIVWMNASLDFDGDTIPDSADSCPTMVDLSDDTDGDGVDAACDTCPSVANAQVSAPDVWMTLTSMQRDDDGDGTGNACDFKYEGNTGTLIGPVDTADMRNSTFKNVSGSDCGASGAKICGQFDHDGLGSFVGPSDVSLLRARSFTQNGPTCAACAGPFSEPLGTGNATAGQPIQCGNLGATPCP